MSLCDVTITGRGVVSPFGRGWDAFAEAVRSGRTAPLGAFPGSSAEDSPPLHVVPDLEPGWGEGEPLSAISIIAAAEALAEAGFSERDRPLDGVGLVMNNVLGPSTAIESYLERLLLKGPRQSRPAQFVDTLLSMPASKLGITLGLRGSTGVMGGSSAIELAFDWLRHGRERTVVAGGGEFQSPKCLRYYEVLADRSGYGRAALAQAAAFVVLQTGDASSAPPIARLLGSGGASEAQEVAVPWNDDPAGECFVRSMREAVADARVTQADITTVALASGESRSEAGEMAAVRTVLGERDLYYLRPKRQFGEALGGNQPLALLATLASLESGQVALVNSFEVGGNAASLLVSL